ncbi:nickel pincer cofactor biosynthesis protein LarB [Methanoregula sp.]|uniref:nickel pincer cofactor biosynthesis protein LarB n=1 Tax=Methanoregula sp. TaxID=2052170 RepID=UPI002C509FE0|nr:nickel pincer cofactor biosynthesis protein LarB [Methanoregula sp.]HVP96739.1 nickel pincer cofactor biosynthesis protein LarB [Methanoregula sp.]
MDKPKIKKLLCQVSEGSLSVDEAILQFRIEPFKDLGFAKVDHHRSLRKGTAEVIYGDGKTPQQIAEISSAMLAHGQKTVLITRMDPEAAEVVGTSVPLRYHRTGRIGIAGELPEPDGKGTIVIATAGTCDIPVAEEAALTALALGNEITRVYDVGVAGLHRLLAHVDDIMSARVIIAVAGMEGALPSVIGGLADCPVIAVPTSIGYGTSFGGLTALFSMLNSCASGVSVVNIDNGFGAGYLASMINHIGVD